LLDDAAIERYARQIVVPGIGAAGQEKLLESTVLLVGHPRGCATAALYLRAAGVKVAIDTPRPSAIVIAGASTLSDDTLAWLASKQSPFCWYDVLENGFTSGVHPASPLPRSSGAQHESEAAVHDAGACAAAALACAVILGIELSEGETRVAL
jgi:hypothetical protein